jgi:methyl-accepting chemotaxis protein
MNIKTRIILLVLVPVLLCVGISGGISAVTSNNTAQANMENTAGYVNSAYAESLTQTLGQYTAQVEAMAREAGFFAEGATEEEKVQLLQRHAANSDIRNIAIFGEDGLNIFIAYDDGTTVPVGVADVSSRSYLPEALAGNTVVFGPSKDVITGDLTITIATPVTVPNAPKSIVAIDFSLDFVDDIVDAAVFGETGSSFLMDSAGMFIASPDDSHIGLSFDELSDGQAGLKSAVQTAVANGSGNLHFDYGNADHYATYTTVEGTDGWIFLSAAQVSEYFAGYNTSIRLQLICLGAFLVVAIVFALFIGQRMSKPIRHATQRVTDLSNGILAPADVSEASKRRDETGQLTRSLDAAITTLRSYVGDISDKLGHIAQGDLTQSVSQEYLGDFAPIKESLTHISDSLNNVIGEIKSSAEQVASGAAHVAQGAQELASGSTEQAASVQQISASISETLRQSEENTKEAGAALGDVMQAGEYMNQSMESMSRLTKAMEDINASSSDISKVIKAIEDIAFQTNILALNAAVEAARAGEAGKGFAVVADEVRNLAQKSAEAAKETSALIENSIEKAAEGNSITAETGESLGKVAEIAGKNAESMQKISQLSEAQTAAITEINSGVQQISTVVQSNSATSEQSAAASEEMSSQAQVMNSVVSRFRLREDAYGASTKAAGHSSVPLPEASIFDDDIDKY